MCLIIHRLSGSNVPNDVLDHNRKKNSDGFGLAWRKNGKLYHEKWGPKDYDGFHKKLKEIDRQPGIEYTAHFRMATHGPACQDLSHPFTYEDKKHGTIAVFHNGIIDIDTDRTKESDTSTFVKQVLARMGSGWWKNPAYRFLVEQAIGYSRLLIMTPTETIRLNERAWSKVGGIMYSTDPGGSHSTYKPKTTPAWTAPKSTGAYASPATKAATTPALYVPGTATGGSVVPYVPAKGSAVTVKDASNFGFIDADDDWEVQSWVHNGHRVESCSENNIGWDGSDDIQVEVVCTECNTYGEVYVIDGTTFIDVVHDGDSDDEDDEDLDALTMARVYAN